jgi:peroxiredoxin
MYLGALNDMAADFAAKGVEIVALSADPVEKAETDKAEMAIDLAVAYNLDLDTMRSWGLFISAPRSDQETDRPFAEPALFLLRPDGTIQIIDISNAPFVRPDLSYVLRGVSAAIDNGYPVRGTSG